MVSQVPLDVIWIISACFETFLYGIYISLFFETVFIMLKKGRMSTTSSKIFFWTSSVIFVLSTVHIFINLFRTLRAYVWLRGVMDPTDYLHNLSHWNVILKNAANAVTTWLADFLVIYRCLIIWNNNYCIIIFPTLLVLLSMAANVIALYQFTHVPLGTYFGPNVARWINTIHALAFVQNTITTGLIAWNIWRQERSVEVDARSTRSSFFLVVRIIVESASIYLLELLILLILYALKHNGQFVLQEIVVPTIGIVFTLMTVRLATKESRSLVTTTASASSRSGIPIQFSAHAGSTVTTSRLGTRTPGLPPQDTEIELKCLSDSANSNELDAKSALR